MSRCFAGMTQKVEFHLLPNRIFRKLFVKGKQPWFTRDSSAVLSSFLTVKMTNAQQSYSGLRSPRQHRVKN